MILYQSKTQDFIIRSTTVSDVPLILSFIKKLSVYEKLEDKMKATEDLLTQTLFINPHAEVIIAEVNQQPIGFALYFYNYSTFLGKPNLYLEDLYLDENYRHKGYGTLILRYLAKYAVKQGCERFDWMCLHWNETALHFYKQLGAKPLLDWVTLRLENEALLECAKSLE